MNLPDEMDDAFGFETVRASAKEKIKHIRPSAPPISPDLKKVDEAADSVGFVSREHKAPEDPGPRRGRPKASEPTMAINMRAPESVALTFQKWCDDNRYSYPAALAEIMRRAGITAAKRSG